MPQLEKGGKWVFGWIMVNQYLKFQVPPDGYDEYGFMTDQELAYTNGSHRSGGFGVSKLEILATNEFMAKRIITKTTMGRNGQITLPAEIGIKPEPLLLAVRGSKYALGFLLKGPIVEAVLLHPEIEVFTV